MIRIFAPLVALAFIGCSQPERVEAPVETPEIVLETPSEPVIEPPMSGWFAVIEYKQGEVIIIDERGPYSHQHICEARMIGLTELAKADVGVVSSAVFLEK